MKKSAVKESLTSRHTPTPLPHSIKQGLEIRKDWNYQANCQEYFVCYKKGPWLFKTADEKEANEFVQAVNALKEMLHALKRFVYFADEESGNNPELRAYMETIAGKAMREVIAKAEGL